MYEASNNRIWIELPKPHNNKHGILIAEQACIVLKSMGVDYDTPVFWDQNKQAYCFTCDSGGGFYEALDNGHWYNLDYLANKAINDGKMVNEKPTTTEHNPLKYVK